MRLTYFAESKGGGFIKIGSSYQVRRRLERLRRTVSGSRLLAVSSMPEGELAAMFHRTHRGRGWYEISPDLLQFVDRFRPGTDALLRAQAKEGLSKFGEFLRDRKIDKAEAARQLGITRAYASMIASGSHAPGDALAITIFNWVKAQDPAGSFRLEDLFDD